MHTYNDGTGDILGTGPCAEPAFNRANQCPQCNGTGTVNYGMLRPRSMVPATPSDLVPCWHCHATGKR
jgi:hypothetical protein